MSPDEIALQRIADLNGSTVLNLSQLNLTKLPENLPENLTVLYCSFNQLTKLPENIPANLTKLYCHDNKLTTAPEKYKDIIFDYPMLLIKIEEYTIYRTNLVNEIPLRLIQEKYLLSNIKGFI
jgi:Leucine-rich repeat (LRR) protein